MKLRFGELLKRYRRDCRDPKYGGLLTQERLAELIGERTKDDSYPNPSTVSYWEADKNMPDAFKRRQVLIALVSVLAEYGTLHSVEETNSFLAAGGYAPLDYWERADVFQFQETKDLGRAGISPESIIPNLSKRSGHDRFDQLPARTHAEVGSNPSIRQTVPVFNGNRKLIFRGEPMDQSNEEEIPKRIDRLSDLTLDARSYKPGSAPRPPSLVIGRENDLRALKNRLGLTEHMSGSIPVRATTFERRLESTDTATLAAVRGWPGVGKTTLAAALAYDSDVIAGFPDGILWASLGQTPNVLSELFSWGRALGSDLSNSTTIEEASAQLAALLRDKQMLLIVDDVWKAAHAVPFEVGGPRCVLLITTRDRDVAQTLAPTPHQIYRLDVLTEEKGLELLQALAPSVTDKHPDESRLLTKKLEGLPLAIQVAGHLLQAEADLGFSEIDLLAELREGAKLLAANAPADQIDLTNEATPTVAALLQKSTDRLDLQTRECFAYLGPFASEPATFDLDAMKAAWQVEDPKPIARTLVEHGLLEPVPETRRFQMHPLLAMHARSLLTWTRSHPKSFLGVTRALAS